MDQINNELVWEEMDEETLNLLFENEFIETSEAIQDQINFNLIDSTTKDTEKKENTRFNEVSSEDVMQFLENLENKNTKRKTKSDIELVKTFLETKNEMRDLEFIPPDLLNEYLSTFLLSVRRKDGGEYEPSTLQSFISTVDRYLKTKGYTTSLRDSIEFTKTRSVLKMKQKQLKQLGKGNKPNASDPLEMCHIQKMYESGTLGDTSPSSLLHSLWLICTTNFGMRTGHEVHCLRWGDIQCRTDENLGEYLIYDTERQTKTRTGANIRNTRLTKPKAFAVPEIRQRDPVHLYKKYAEMRPAEMLDPESPFFLSVANKTPKPGQAWYKKQGMGINKIYNIMREMKEEAGIESDKRITPYSARKHLIQTLEDNCVPSHQIVQVSGHKNINSLNNYSKMNNNQSKAISDILINRPQSQSVTRPAALSEPNQANSTAIFHPAQTNSSNQPSFSGNYPFPMFMGSTFNGPVNFHFESNSSNTKSVTQTAVCQSSSSSPDIEPRRWKRIKYMSDSSELTSFP